MNTYDIALIPGDGIGPEVVGSALELMKKAAVQTGDVLNFTEYPFGGGHFLRTGEILSTESEAKLRKHQAIFLGAIGHPEVKPGIVEVGVLLHLRFAFDLYINLRPVKLYPGVECPLKNKTPDDIDYVVVRENTGGLYCGVGGSTQYGLKDEAVTQVAMYTHNQVERCLRFAFETARERPRKTLALVGKSNVLTHLFGLWIRVFNELGEAEFPDIKREYYHVDAASMMMVSCPEKFDVMVTTNMFGDILTDLGATTQGGMGMAASGNLNPDRTSPSMFEPVHGSAPDIAGQDKANPIAAWQSARMMLDFLGAHSAAEKLENAILQTLQAGVQGLKTTEITALGLSFI